MRMIIKKFGVVLESLTPETAELVRIWRNNSDINQFMDYRKQITVNEQKRWFEKIQNTNSNYFLIRKNELPIGMIHIEKIDLNKQSAHVGLFIGDVNYHGTGVALSASLCLLEYAFGSLSLHSVVAKVKNDNTLAIEYNQFLGFESHEKFNDEFSYWILTRKRFELKKDALLKYVNFIN